MIVISIYSSVSTMFNDENITVICTILSIVLLFILFIVAIKKYLRSTNETIINMKDTEEGKKERKAYLIKKYVYIFIGCFIFGIVIDLGSIANGNETLLSSILTNGLIIGILDIILFANEYRKMEENVKELNK